MGIFKNSPGCQCCEEEESCGVNDDTSLFEGLVLSGVPTYRIEHYIDPTDLGAGTDGYVDFPDINGTYLISAIEPDEGGTGNCDIPSGDLPIQILGGSSKSNCCHYKWVVDDTVTLLSVYEIKRRVILEAWSTAPDTDTIYYNYSSFLSYKIPCGAGYYYAPGGTAHAFSSGTAPGCLDGGATAWCYKDINNVSGSIPNPQTFDLLWYGGFGGDDTFADVTGPDCRELFGMPHPEFDTYGIVEVQLEWV